MVGSAAFPRARLLRIGWLAIVFVQAAVGARGAPPFRPLSVARWAAFIGAPFEHSMLEIVFSRIAAGRLHVGIELGSKSGGRLNTSEAATLIVKGFCWT